jgi:2-keto-4-pentenoate hydratase
MDTRLTELADWLQQQCASPQPMTDILKRAPEVSFVEAYRVQQILMERCVASGDRVVGYKAAFTSKGMQERFGVGEPLVGTLLASRVTSDDTPVPVRGYLKAILEPEVGVLLRADVSGPVTRLEAMAAIAGYLPCVEVADVRTGSSAFSPQQALACNTFNGMNVFGGPLTAPEGIDLRTEGVVLRVNGEVRNSATAVEVLGDPINAVVFMANKVAELGWSLKAGMVLMTGGIVASVAVRPGDEIHADFTRLGQVRLRIAD